MKELTIEQKAKRYVEALNIARALNRGEHIDTPSGTTVCETIFPELIENEDEDIRQFLVDFIKECKWTDKKNQGWPSREECIDWLEKQGEQKSDEIITTGYWNVQNIEQKIADVEPKFHKGDWIVRSAKGFKHDMYLVKEIKDYYVCEESNGNLVTFTFNDVHKNFKLWTINNAENGDILATQNAVFIFKHFDKTGLSLCKSHCEVIGCSELGFGFDFSTHYNIYPATKQQRDILMKAIIDAGYTFDFEKKELKKIEQKPVNKVEPKFCERDWIIHQGTDNVYQVVAIVNKEYQLKYGNNYTFQECADVDRCARLWDVTKDAKDGDVLIASDGSIFLFKCVDGCACKYYVARTNIGTIVFNEGLKHFWETTRAVHPATEEQRNTLMDAIVNAGYIFDVYNKKLKKITKL